MEGVTESRERGLVSKEEGFMILVKEWEGFGELKRPLKEELTILEEGSTIALRGVKVKRKGGGGRKKDMLGVFYEVWEKEGFEDLRPFGWLGGVSKE